MNLQYCDLGSISYQAAWQLQESLRRKRIEGEIPDTLLLLEHPPVITLGRRASDRDILLQAEDLSRRGVEVVRIDRGGEVTYHGPGQLVGYLIFHLAVTKGSIKQFVYLLEQALIQALSRWGIEAGRHPLHRGVWVGPEKIAALGLSVSRQVTTHGFALNVSTDLSAFRWIVPCGIREAGVTSMDKILKRSVPIEEVKPIVVEEISRTFGFTSVRTADSCIDLDQVQFGSQVEASVAGSSLIRRPAASVTAEASDARAPAVSREAHGCAWNPTCPGDRPQTGSAQVSREAHG